MNKAQDNSDVLSRLYDVIVSRRDGNTATSYTAKLLAQGTDKIAQKLGEEAVETVIAAVTKNNTAIIAESADLLYHLLVTWADAGVLPQEVLTELERREGESGLAEKESRKK